MAEKLSTVKRMEIPEEVVHEENLDEVIKAVGDNKDAILKGIELLEALEKNGLLDMLNALIKHKEDALENVMSQLNKPEYSSVIENVIKLSMFAGKLNVNEIGHFIDRINQGLEEAQTAQNMEKTSYTGLLKALKDPEINRSVTILLQFLRGMGRN